MMIEVMVFFFLSDKMKAFWKSPTENQNKKGLVRKRTNGRWMSWEEITNQWLYTGFGLSDWGSHSLPLFLLRFETAIALVQRVYGFGIFSLSPLLFFFI
jgi:hypothetical protein